MSPKEEHRQGQSGRRHGVSRSTRVCGLGEELVSAEPTPRLAGGELVPGAGRMPPSVALDSFFFNQWDLEAGSSAEERGEAVRPSEGAEMHNRWRMSGLERKGVPRALLRC